MIYLSNSKSIINYAIKNSYNISSIDDIYFLYYVKLVYVIIDSNDTFLLTLLDNYFIELIYISSKYNWFISLLNKMTNSLLII